MSGRMTNQMETELQGAQGRHEDQENQIGRHVPGEALQRGRSHSRLYERTVFLCRHSSKVRET